MGGSDSPTLNRRHRELDDIYETYRAEREKERVKLRQRSEVPDTVPFFVGEGLQLWIQIGRAHV